MDLKPVLPMQISFRHLTILLLCMLAFGTLACLGPIPQDKAYHAFADQRSLLLPNALNVLTNLSFLLAGLLGLHRLKNYGASPSVSRWRYFYGIIIFVGVGSAYYHLSPSNTTLVYDRLPMALGFAIITSCLFSERWGEAFGSRICAPLVFFNILAVVYWAVSEKIGFGDLRPYILAQYLPMLLIPVMLVLFPMGRRFDRPYWLLLIGYLLAKGFEFYDLSLLHATAGLISGHSLKHLAAAAAIATFSPVVVLSGSDLPPQKSIDTDSSKSGYTVLTI